MAKIHLPPTPLSYTTKQVQNGRNASSADARYRLDVGKSPRTEAGCSATADNEGACGAGSDDTDYDSITATNQRPLYTFAVRNTNNTDTPTATWIGRSNIAPSTAGTAGDIVLQVYRFGTTNAWENVTTNTSCAADTDCTLTGSPSGTLSEYYEADGSNYWLYVRLWQYENAAAETLKTDSFAVSFPTGRRRVFLIQ
ncbi:MAG: hypothetical protein Q8R91_07310 [Candidatus Omnitrophota bacterium]|nr:hypothetical protein [Candidatus Omnitrophota bacterium]